MSDVKFDCMNNDSDEDCYKCCIHGFIWGCDDDCKDYKPFSGFCNVSEIERDK